MLPAKHRLMLRQNPTFFVKSQKIHTPLFTIFYRRTDLEFSLGSVVVPKKKVPLATGRNLAKRQVNELLYSLFKTKTNLEIVVLVKKILAPADLQSLTQTLVKL